MKTHLVFALMTVALLALVISQKTLKTVTFSTVVDRFTREPYHEPKPPPDALKNLNYDQTRDIRYSAQGNQVVQRRDVTTGSISGPRLLDTLRDTISSAMYRIHPDRVQEEMQRIWKREMTFGSYRPKWLNCVVGDETFVGYEFDSQAAQSFAQT